MRGPRFPRFQLSDDGTRWIVFDATGGFVRSMPVIAGADDPRRAGDADGEGVKKRSSTADANARRADDTDDAGKGKRASSAPPPDDVEALRKEHEALRRERDELLGFKQKAEPELKRARDDAAKYRTDAQKRAKAAARKALEDAGIEVPAELADGSGDGDAVAAAAAAHKADLEKKDDELRVRDIRDAVRDACDEQAAKFKPVYGSLLTDNAFATLDPTANDFKTKITKLVQDTVEADASLKTGRDPQKSGADLKGGGTTDKPKDPDVAFQDSLKKRGLVPN